jgi:hypothetical protein
LPERRSWFMLTDMLGKVDDITNVSGGADSFVCILLVSVWAVSALVSGRHLTTTGIMTYGCFGNHERNSQKTTFSSFRNLLE